MVDAKSKSSRKNFLERNTSEGDSPVSKDDMTCSKRVGSPGLEA